VNSGPSTKPPGRALKVELAYVEQALGPFPAEQLAAAALRVSRMEENA